MKNESLKPQKIYSELPKLDESFGEMLDFSELMSVKGGKVDPTKPASGNAGGLVCWCK